MQGLRHVAIHPRLTKLKSGIFAFFLYEITSILLQKHAIKLYYFALLVGKNRLIISAILKACDCYLKSHAFLIDNTYFRKD